MLGNITQKSGQGTYIYEAPTDRLTSVGANAYNYDDNGNVLSDGERTLTWTAQNKVRSLNRNGDAWSLLYDADGTRVVREEAAANEATYNVSPTYELRFEGSSLSQSKISVLGTTGRVVAEVVADRTELASNERWENTKSFVHDDHLGSTHAVTDREAAVQSRVMYGPWGRARDGDNWYFLLDEADLEDLPVGFTGHQPELDAGLINMRGRMYDPAVGRFMSVDPVIEDALEVGTWNAYSYVQNRPLSLVDPTGLASEEPIDREAFVKMEAAFEVLYEGGYVDADGDGADLRADFLMPSPRVEDEVAKEDGGLPVEGGRSECYPSRDELPGAPEEDGRDPECPHGNRNCIAGLFAREALKRTAPTKEVIEDWALAMEIALTVADGVALIRVVGFLAKMGRGATAYRLLYRFAMKHSDDFVPAVARARGCFAAGTTISLARVGKN
ncbi:MAG: RHS repeat domain-containing protein [Nannocystaceae bacterium]|nr:RHS repeat-associated core domain-containing protein [bacterium]